MASQRPEGGDVAVDDLESTAKLPVLDVAALDAVEDESHLRTTVLPPDVFHTSDTHPGIPILKESTGLTSAEARVVVRAAVIGPDIDADAAGGAADSRAAAEAEAVVGQLHERQAALLREMQELREEAEARYERLEADLDAARRLGEDLDAMRREAEARTLAAEQRSAALEAEFAAAHAKLAAEAVVASAAVRRTIEGELATALGQLEADLQAARSQLEAQTQAALRREAELAAARQQHESELAAERRRGEAEVAAARQQGATELAGVEEQLATRAAAHDVALQAAHAEAAEAARQLAELRGLRAEDEAALLQAREELARLGRALDEERANFASTERAIVQSLAERSRELDLVRGELAEVRALAAAQVEALQGAESRRGIWASLLGDAESAHDEQLREARVAGDAERIRAAAVQAELDERARRHAELAAALRAELEAASSRALGAEARSEELRSTLAQAEAVLESTRADAGTGARRLVELEAQLAALREREGETAQQAEAAAAHGAESARLLHELQARFDESEAAVRAEALAAREPAADQAESLRALQDELRRGAERVAELESDLRAAEDQVNRLEGELRARNSRLEEMGRARWPPGAAPDVPPGGTRRRDDYAARGRGAPEVGSSGESALPADSAFSGAGAAAHAGGITRYFVLMEGDTEIVHVLGRRTTIGRGLDNDVRIDTKFISRHHAVVLAGPNQTVVEDLRSTNGVLVNGRRVTRSVLRDGDIVHVGKTQFRFVQRSRDR